MDIFIIEVRSESGLQMISRVKEAAHDSAFGYAQDLGDFVVLQAVYFAKDDDRSMFFAEGIERFLYLIAEFGAGINLFGINAEAWRQDFFRAREISLIVVIELDFAGDFFTPVTIDSEVFDDAISPGEEVGSWLILVDIGVDANETLLRDFESVLLAVNDRESGMNDTLSVTSE